MAKSVLLEATPNPNSQTFPIWTLYDPSGNVVDISQSTTSGLAEAAALAGNANDTLSGPGYDLLVRGFNNQNAGPANLPIGYPGVVLPPRQGNHTVFECVSLTNDGCMERGNSMLTIESMLIGRIEGPGSEMACGGTWAKNVPGLLIRPTMGVPQAPSLGAPAIVDSSFYWTSLCSVGVICVTAQITLKMDVDEWNGYGADYCLAVAQGANGQGNWSGARISTRHMHGFSVGAMQIGNQEVANTGNQQLDYGSEYDIGGISADGFGANVGIATFGSNAIFTVSNSDPAVTRLICPSAGSANNRFKIIYSPTGVVTPLPGTNNLIVDA